jgi:hypothetical protein
MQYEKTKLLKVAEKIERQRNITPDELTLLLSFEKAPGQSRLSTILKRTAVPLSLIAGFFFYAFPDDVTKLAVTLPAWTNFSPPILSGIDYLWNIIGEPVGKANILYHIPNIVLYSFGILGVKKLLDAVDKRTWLDRVLIAQNQLREQNTRGVTLFNLQKGHSILFVGKGDFIGMQFALNHPADELITISQTKPLYTNIWSYYDVETLYDDLKQVLIRADGEDAGEYIFFPVKDDQIFLPGEKAYDLSPHKIDILCQNIRTIEKELGWKPKRILIIGDKFHKSFVQSEDAKRVIAKSEDIISLTSIAKKYNDVSLLDPTDIVLNTIIKIAKGRKIVFRATKEGIAEYKARFYDRLSLLGYTYNPNTKGILTIGYDLFEDQTEQQTLSRKIDDYYPVVLSKSVHDALIRNGYKKSEFLYVPDLVLTTLSRVATEQ